MQTSVTAVPPAASSKAREHFANEFRFETDCWDVHDALEKGADFVLLDVRSPAMFAKGHVPGAINLPPARSSPRRSRNGLGKRSLSPIVPVPIVMVQRAAP